MKNIKIKGLIVAGIFSMGMVFGGCGNPEEKIQKNLELGSRYYSEENYDKALKSYDKILELDGENTEAMIKKAEIHAKKKEYEEAEKLLKNLLDQDDKKVLYYNEMIEILEKSERDPYEIIAVMEEGYKKTKSSTFKDMIKEMTPEKPEVSLSSGIYKENKVVEFLHIKEGESVYYTTDGSEADKDSTKYSKPIQLTEGTTEIRAIKENATGVISESIHKKYEVQIPKEVLFKDKAFESIVREAINKESGSLYTDELENVESLDIIGTKNYDAEKIDYYLYGKDMNDITIKYQDGSEIKTQRGDVESLEDLIWFTNLKHLNIQFNNIENLEPLKEMKNLIELNLGDNKIEDLSALKDMKYLKELSVNNNHVSDVSPLKNLKRLYLLDINKTFVEDLSPLKEIERLQILFYKGRQAIDMIK